MNKILNLSNNQEVHDKCLEISNLQGINKIVIFKDASIKNKYKDRGYKFDIPSGIVVSSDKNILYPQIKSTAIGCGISIIDFKTEYNYEKFLDIKKYFLNYKKRTLRRFYFQKILDYLPSNLYYNEIKKYLNSSSSIFLRSVKIGDLFRMAFSFSGNHFFEIGVVDKIYNHIGAQKFNIKKGNMFIIWHSGGIDLKECLDNSLYDKYILKDQFVPVTNYQEIKYLNKIYSKINLYSYFEKILFFAYFNLKFKNIKLLYTSNHNSVILENDKYIYRHNLNNLEPKKIGFISGNYNHCSYLIQGEKGLTKYLNSIDHGLGGIIEKCSHKKEHYSIETERGNKFFKTKKENIPLLCDEVISKELKSYEDLSLINRIARFRPIYNYKDI